MVCAVSAIGDLPVRRFGLFQAEQPSFCRRLIPRHSPQSRPNVLLCAVAVPDDRLQASSIRRRDLDDYPFPLLYNCAARLTGKLKSGLFR
jgi:hypothetical protein